MVKTRINEKRITLLQGDCLELMKGLKSKSIDMILCDLPYGTTACKWDTIISFGPLWNCYKRIIKDHGAIVLFGSQPFTSALIMSNIEWFKYLWIWDKKIPAGMSYARYRPMQQTEDISIFSRDGNKTIYNPQMILREKPIKGGGMKHSDSAMTKGYIPLKKTYTHKNPITLIEFDKIRRGSLHPTQKPVSLLEYLIKTYSNQDDLILDNCMGSGSTGVACKNLDRKFIGMELDEKYYEIAKRRICV